MPTISEADPRERKGCARFLVPSIFRMTQKPHQRRQEKPPQTPHLARAIVEEKNDPENFPNFEW